MLALQRPETSSVYRFCLPPNGNVWLAKLDHSRAKMYYLEVIIKILSCILVQRSSALQLKLVSKFESLERFSQ